MHVRGFALALPLVLGIACTHTRSERADNATAKSGANQPSETASAPTPEPRTAQPNTAPGAEATAQAGQVDQNQTTSEPRTAHENTVANSPSGATTGTGATASSGLPENDQTTSEPRLPQETTAPSSPDTTSSATAPSSPSGSSTGSSSSSTGSSSSLGSSATGDSASASDVARDPLIELGDPAKAHADDTVVSGKIAKLTHRQLVIRTDAGEKKSLSIVPQTEFQVNGQDAKRTDVKEGQEVRASFNQVDGKDVAVKVRAGRDLGSSSSYGSGASGSASYGSGSVSGSTGGTASPDASGRPAPADDPSHNIHQGEGETGSGENGSLGPPSVPQTDSSGSSSGAGR